MMRLSGGTCSPGEGCRDRSPSPLTPTSLSGLFVAEWGADVLVGVVISIGSPGDGADIWIVGGAIGTVLAPIGSSGPSAKWVLGALSVAVAICPTGIAIGVSKSGSERRKGGQGKKTSTRDPQDGAPAPARKPSTR